MIALWYAVRSLWRQRDERLLAAELEQRCRRLELVAAFVRERGLSLELGVYLADRLDGPRWPTLEAHEQRVRELVAA